MKSSRKQPTRRRFLESTAALIGLTPLTPLLIESVGLFLRRPAHRVAAAAGPSVIAEASPYRCLNRTEAAFTECMVNVLCPADHLTPNGVTCGLAVFIDRALAGGSTADALGFKAGIAAANAACLWRAGVRFDELSPDDAGGFVHDIFAGDVDAEVPLASWAHDVVHPLLLQACFTGPIYEGYSNRVFWKVFGHAPRPTLA
jgi:gluconate 2-dehydrogenase gamma chain